MKSFFLSFSLSIFLLCCNGDDNDEHYPDEPQIEFKSIDFREANGPDTLALTFSYQDGNADLGMSWEEQVPGRLYFLTSGDSLVRLEYHTSNTLFSEPTWYFDSPIPGKMATSKTRENPKFSYLPPDGYPYSCNNYNYHNDIWVDSKLVDEDEAEVDVLDYIKYPNGKLIQVRNHNGFYMERNEDAYTIFVDFFIEQEDGTFVEFDWTTDLPSKNCAAGFDTIFPRITKDEHEGPFEIDVQSPYRGEITYYMLSPGFIDLFGQARIKLKIQIQDRALNKSNIIETEPFFLLP